MSTCMYTLSKPHSLSDAMLIDPDGLLKMDQTDYYSAIASAGFGGLCHLNLAG